MSFFTIKRFDVSKLLKHLLLCIIITITPIFITKTPVVASLACFDGLCGTPGTAPTIKMMQWQPHCHGPFLDQFCSNDLTSKL
jgi:hypothetical protein